MGSRGPSFRPGPAPAPQRVECCTHAASSVRAGGELAHAIRGAAGSRRYHLYSGLPPLLDRRGIRDLFLHLLGGWLLCSTDALQEASARIGRCLLMRLLVNFSYGVQMAVGLWMIGVPGALLWGVVAAAMRFIP